MPLRNQPIMTPVTSRNIQAHCLVTLVVSILVLQNIGPASSYQCYQCVYTNVTRYLKRKLPIINAQAGKEMVPVSACSDTHPQIEKHLNSDYIEVNPDCPYGCATIVIEFQGKKIVNRGCVRHSFLCGNYTVGETSQSCCKGDRCNGGPHKKPQEGPYSCYQCVGSTSNNSKREQNVYANKSMVATKDCLDDSFNPNSPHVEVNHSCKGGCLSATMVPLGDPKNRIVMRGCASPKGLPCISMNLKREVLQGFAQIYTYDSMEQKCCNSPYCNAGSAVNSITFNSTSLESKYDIVKDEKDVEQNSVQKGIKGASVLGASGRLFSSTEVTLLCQLSVFVTLVLTFCRS